MKGFKTQAKHVFEILTNNQVWLEPSSDLNEVRKFISKLSPISIDLPLIRIGSKEDGGYLVPEDLDGIVAAISPGVSTEIGFDLAMADRGIDVFMADASVASPPIKNNYFHFHKKFIDVFEDDQNMRLDSLCGAAGPESIGDKILQMDIEGAEYRVLLDASDEVLKDFRIMVIEFHQLDRMYAAFPFRMIRATFQKLLRFHHIVHIHPNNVAFSRKRDDLEIPPIMEFTFLRKDRSKILPGKKISFPHPLDRDNLAYLPTLVLPKCWQYQDS